MKAASLACGCDCDYDHRWALPSHTKWIKRHSFTHVSCQHAVAIKNTLSGHNSGCSNLQSLTQKKWSRIWRFIPSFSFHNFLTFPPRLQTQPPLCCQCHRMECAVCGKIYIKKLKWNFASFFVFVFFCFFLFSFVFLFSKPCTAWTAPTIKRRRPTHRTWPSIFWWMMLN